MTLLLRAVGTGWINAGGLNLEEPLPFWAIRYFWPSEKDEGGLSMFEVADEEQARTVAGAIAMSRANLAEHVHFASAARQDIEEAGFEIKATPGGLLHEFADAAHRDVPVAQYEVIPLLVRCFAAGTLIAFNGKEAAAAARAAIRADQFLCREIALAPNFEKNMRGKNLLKFIGEEIAVVRGVQAA